MPRDHPAIFAIWRCRLKPRRSNMATVALWPKPRASFSSGVVGIALDYPAAEAGDLIECARRAAAATPFPRCFRDTKKHVMRQSGTPARPACTPWTLDARQFGGGAKLTPAYACVAVVDQRRVRAALRDQLLLLRRFSAADVPQPGPLA